MRDSSFHWSSLFLLVVFALWSVFLLSYRIVEATPSTPLIIEATTYSMGSTQLVTINNNLFRYGQYCGPGPGKPRRSLTLYSLHILTDVLLFHCR